MPGSDEAVPRAAAADLVFRRAVRGFFARLLIAVAYLLLMARLGTTGPAHWLLAAMWLFGPLLNARIRACLFDAVPFVLFAAAYDALGLLRVHVASSGVHTFGPYWLDKTLFGTGPLDHRISLNELFAAHHWPAIDFITGLAYFLYLYAVAGLALFLGLIDRSPSGRERLRALGWTFLGVNLAGFATYLLFPVAPPWYIAAHGFGPVDVNAAASEAALARFDAMMGVGYFRGFYSHASDVFGAMPSMHCAYPMLLLLFGGELGNRRLIAALAVFQLVMSYAAVYLQHHYVLDVLVGALFAFAGYHLERRLTGRADRSRPKQA
jgi:membrane-associated phospholipid phosphatase